MLESLSIKNIVLIDSLTLDFGSHFNALTGESGAGKSILILSISFLLGAKASSDIIREGADEGSVSAVFSIAPNNKRAREYLETIGVELENDSIIIRRSIKRGGRILNWISGLSFSRAELLTLTSFLLDIHGQHDHQSLFKIEEHRRFLDGFAGIEGDVLAFTKLYTHLSHIKDEYKNLLQGEKDKKDEMELLNFAIDEIEKANLKDGEEEKLKDEEKKIVMFEKLYDLISSVSSLLGDDGGALSQTRRATRGLDIAKDIDASLSEYAKRLESAGYELEDVFHSIASYHANMKSSDERLEEVQARLSQISSLKKKYGSSIQEIISYYEKAKKSILDKGEEEDRKKEMAKKIKEIEGKLLDMGARLTKSRMASKESLEKKVEHVLSLLGMKGARFSCNIVSKEEKDGYVTSSPYGFDDVEFLISANEGESLRPLAKIASGGEVSRIMLALKTVLSSDDDVETLIFDEIDVGIGGEVAKNVALHIKELSKKKQILLITHLAIIASFADKHIKVEKSSANGATKTNAFPIASDRRVEEIARMLSGDVVSEASLSHALELLKEHSSEFGLLANSQAFLI